MSGVINSEPIFSAKLPPETRKEFAVYQVNMTIGVAQLYGVPDRGPLHRMQKEIGKRDPIALSLLIESIYLSSQRVSEKGQAALR